MKSVAVAFVLCGLCSAVAVQEHPIGKVINMLEKLKDKAIQEGKEEAVAFEKFKYWCSESTSTLDDAIADEKETIGELEDKLSGLNKRKEGLEAEISTLQDQIADLDASAKAAKAKRESEAGLYSDANDALASTIDAVQGCIAALEGAESKTEGLLQARQKVKSVLSLLSLKVTSEQHRRLQAFAAPRPDQLAAGDEAAHVDKYDFKSENVIELLKQLKLSFEDERLAGTKAETNAVNGYELAKQARDNARTAAKNSMTKKETELGETDAAIKQAVKDLNQWNKDLKADTKTLQETTSECRMRTDEWEVRSNTRTLEIEAMDQAMKILSKSSGVRTEAPGNPVPPPSPANFLQTLLSSSDPKMKAVALLKEAAKNTKSRALERLAVEVAAHLNGPFDQVNNMIEKMIFRLMDEQKQEDEHKNWCDQEISKTRAMAKDKNERIADHSAEIKEETAAVGMLTKEIADAQAMISDIVEFQAEATAVRNTGKSENKAAIKDSQQAQKSLSNAIAVLEAFYKESGQIAKEDWEFVQAPVKLPKDPKLWDSSYTGAADPKKADTGIIAVLEAVLSDFENMEAETKSQEAQDQKAFEDDMSANDIEKAERTQEVDMKTSEKAGRADKIASLSRQKKDTEGELEKTEQYMTDLKPACVNGDSSYGDRKDARATEVTALKKAKQVLADAFNEQAGAKFLQINRH